MEPEWTKLGFEASGVTRGRFEYWIGVDEGVRHSLPDGTEELITGDIAMADDVIEFTPRREMN